MILVFFHSVQPLEIEGVIAFGLEESGLLVPAVGKAGVDFGDFNPQRRVDEDRDLELEAVQLVEQFLGPAQGEGGDIDDALVGESLLQQLL